MKKEVQEKARILEEQWSLLKQKAEQAEELEGELSHLKGFAHRAGRTSAELAKENRQLKEALAEQDKGLRSTIIQHEAKGAELEKRVAMLRRFIAEQAQASIGQERRTGELLLQREKENATLREALAKGNKTVIAGKDTILAKQQHLLRELARQHKEQRHELQLLREELATKSRAVAGLEAGLQEQARHDTSASQHLAKELRLRTEIAARSQEHSDRLETSQERSEARLSNALQELERRAHLIKGLGRKLGEAMRDRELLRGQLSQSSQGTMANVEEMQHLKATVHRQSASAKRLIHHLVLDMESKHAASLQRVQEQLHEAHLEREKLVRAFAHAKRLSDIAARQAIDRIRPLATKLQESEGSLTAKEHLVRQLQDEHAKITEELHQKTQQAIAQAVAAHTKEELRLKAEMHALQQSFGTATHENALLRHDLDEAKTAEQGMLRDIDTLYHKLEQEAAKKPDLGSFGSQLKSEIIGSIKAELAQRDEMLLGEMRKPAQQLARLEQQFAQKPQVIVKEKMSASVNDKLGRLYSEEQKILSSGQRSDKELKKLRMQIASLEKKMGGRQAEELAELKRLSEEGKQLALSAEQSSAAARKHEEAVAKELGGQDRALLQRIEAMEQRLTSRIKEIESIAELPRKDLLKLQNLLNEEIAKQQDSAKPQKQEATRKLRQQLAETRSQAEKKPSPPTPDIQHQETDPDEIVPLIEISLQHEPSLDKIKDSLVSSGYPPTAVKEAAEKIKKMYGL
ncbi:MAG: hypothetical protein V1735_01725 [Nanoarchaeota archaeon]